MFSVGLLLLLIIKLAYPQHDIFTTDISEAERAMAASDFNLITASLPNCIGGRCFLFALKKRSGSGQHLSSSSNPWLRVSKQPQPIETGRFLAK